MVVTYISETQELSAQFLVPQNRAGIEIQKKMMQREMQRLVAVRNGLEERQ